MSFLLKNSKKLLIGNNKKIIDVNKNLDIKPKLIPNKKFNEIDLSKLYSNLKNFNVIKKIPYTIKY